MSTHHLDDILAALNRHQQRATYAAVASLVGATPRRLMQGRTREPGNSWIVSKSTKLPTGYDVADIHPQLAANEKVLMTGEELAVWLADK
jgi:hypothetical protein